VPLDVGHVDATDVRLANYDSRLLIPMHLGGLYLFPGRLSYRFIT